jgi:hypothetical protein
MNVLHACCITKDAHGVARGRLGSTGGTCNRSPNGALSRTRPAEVRLVAEGERFELSDDVTAVNGFRDRPVQPLRHPSKGLRS